MPNNDIVIPDTYKKEINLAVKILKKEGCKKIFLFGSLAEGNVNQTSDIDIAISGCPTGKFFHLLGLLLLKLNHPVDLINLDSNEMFAQYLKERGELFKIG